MKKKLFYLVAACLCYIPGCILGIPSDSDSGMIPAGRRIDWSNAGLPGGIPDYPVEHSVLEFNAVADGVTDNSVFFQNAIDATSPGHALLVPAGTYHLDSGITITKGIVLRGEGPDKTIIECDGSDSLIYMRPESFNTLDYVDITGGTAKGSKVIKVRDASSFSAGDYVLIKKIDDQPQQHAVVESVRGNALTLNTGLYMDFFPRWLKSIF